MINLHELIQCSDQSINFFLTGVVHERDTQGAVLGVDSQSLDKAVRIEMAGADAQPETRKLRGQFGWLLTINSEGDGGCTARRFFLAYQANLRVSGKKIEQGLQQF